MRYETPVQLDDLKSLFREGDRDVELEVRVTDANEEPLPFALLRMEWPEEGWMAFQTDEKGVVAMGFRPNFETSGVALSVDVKPMGQDLLATTYEEASTHLEDAVLWLRVVR